MPHWLAIKIDIIFGIAFFLINFICKPSNLYWKWFETCLVSGLLNFEHPSVLLFCSLRLIGHTGRCFININNLIFHVN